MVQQRGNEYMTVDEAAQYLEKTPRTVQRYANEGRLQRYKRGFRTMFLRSDVERLFRELDEIRLEDRSEDK